MTEIILIVVLSAIAAAAGVSIGVVRKYKRGVDSPIYPLEHYTSLNLISREDRFLNRHVTRVRVQSSDNNKKK